MSAGATTSPIQGHRLEDLSGIEILGMLAILVAGILRTVVSIDPFPYWASNPLESWIGLTGLSPVGQLVCDCGATIGAGLLLWGLARSGVVCKWWQIVLTLPAIGVACWWGMKDGGSADHLLAGMPWVAGISSAVAISTVMQVSQARRVVSAVVIGICAMLALKAAMQVFVEHPNLVRDFKENRQAIFAANGWTAESSMARAYERRVMQSEATGWFGLANPLATIGAAVLVFGAAVTIPLRGEKARRGIGIVLSMIGATITVLAGAKGGYAAVIGGSAMLILAVVCGWPKLSEVMRNRLRRFGLPLAGVCCVAVPLTLVAVRGVVDERLGELSIWFRAMYLEAAARIFTQHPLVGVGPAGFKDAYLLNKNPLNPEEVASPHSVIADFVSGLGIAGVFLGVFVVGMAAMSMMQVGGAVTSAPVEESGDDDRDVSDRRLVAISLVVPVLIAAYLERDIATIENLVVRVVGLAISVYIAVQVTSISGRRLAVAGGVAALAAILHAQIEMTPILPSSSGWFWILVGMGAAPFTHGNTIRALGKSTTFTGAVTLVLAGGVVMAAALPGVARWNASLRDAALAVRPLAEVKVLLAQGARDPIAMKDALQQLSQAAGKPVGANETEVNAAVQAMLDSGTDQAARAMLRASKECHGHYGTLRAYSQLLMLRADLAWAAGRRESAKELADQAVAVVSSPTATSNAARLGWIGTLWIERAKRGMDGIPALEQADHAFEASGKLDPWSLNPLLRHIEVAKNLGDEVRAASLAKSALWLHEWMRLDPLKGLTDREKAELERLARVKPGMSGGGRDNK